VTEFVISSTEGRVGIVRLNRPEARNALNGALMEQLTCALKAFEEDEAIGAIILTGGDHIFSAGADIKEMRSLSFAEAYLQDFVTKGWEPVPKCRKPVIAAIAGFAVGGGCEIALSCDLIVADETARFGQPEVQVGTIPGGGGTQRLARLIGKSRAMEMCLTGRLIDASEAERIGIVTSLVPAGQVFEQALVIATRIANYSLPIVMLIKEAIERGFEGSLSEGLRFERRMLHATFALDDQKEAMTAFAEKRTPRFRNC